MGEPLEKQTYVTLQSPGLGLHGTASVRTCARKGMKYIVGLEFSAGLKWKPKSLVVPTSANRNYQSLQLTISIALRCHLR